MAPFVFAGSRYDEALRNEYTRITAADVFEAGGSSQSFVNSWPLRDQIAKQVTPALLADIAAEHRRGNNLFIATFDIDAERSMIWNMGAIAGLPWRRRSPRPVPQGAAGIDLDSRHVASQFVIDVEADEQQFAEMHVDGGLGGQFFVAPPALMASNSDYHLPATQLYVVVTKGFCDYAGNFLINYAGFSAITDLHSRGSSTRCCGRVRSSSRRIRPAG